MSKEELQLDDKPESEGEPKERWAAEIIGTTESGHAVKIQVTFDAEPNHDREAKLRADGQAVMRRQHAEFCNAMSYRKWRLPDA